MTALRDTSDLVWPAIQETLASLDLKPEDAAARKLAQRYAQIIDQAPDHSPRGAPDQAWAARWLMPLLLDCLRELGATPAARAAITKGARDKGSGAAKPRTQLDIMREQREQRGGRRGRA